MIYTPSNGPSDWQALLAEPEKHWRRGYSARSTAHCWEAADGFPPEIRRALTSEPTFSEIEPLVILPEHQVPLAGGSRPSQNDVWVLARLPDGLVSITVEAKASEPFGPTLDEWDPESSPGKTTRLASLCEILGLDSDPPGDLRYQLLHRTASALIEAERFHASYAVMLVHAFNAPEESVADFHHFVEVLGGRPGDDLISIGQREQVSLYLGWVTGSAEFLEA